MWSYDALVGLSLLHLGFPPCPEGDSGIGLFEDLRARIGENMHACWHGDAAGAVRHRQRLDPVADAHLERHREGLAVLCLPGEGHLVAGTGFDQFGQRGVIDVDIEQPLIILARGLLHEADEIRSEEHTSELQSLMRISYAVFCLKKKNR